MRRRGDKKGSARTLVVLSDKRGLCFCCAHNLPQGCVLLSPLLRHLVVIVLFACVRYFVALPFHAYLERNSDINSNKRRIVCFKKSIDS